MIISDNHLVINDANRAQNAQNAHNSQTAGQASAAEAAAEVKAYASSAEQASINAGNNLSTATYTATVNRALEQAGLAMNAHNFEIVSLLLDSGMSISRDSIRNAVTQTAAHPDAQPATLIDMMKSGIEINPENIRIVQSFTEHSQNMAAQINELADMIETILSDPSTPPELDTALRTVIYETVTQAEQDRAGNYSESLSNIAGSADSQAAQAGESASSVTGEVASRLISDAPAQNSAAAQTALNDTATVPSGSQVMAQPHAVTGASAAVTSQNPVQIGVAADTAVPQRIVVETTPASLPEQPETEQGGGSFGSQGFDGSANAFSQQQAAQTLDTSATGQVLTTGGTTVIDEKLYADLSSANLEAAQEADEVFTNAMESNPDRTGLHRMLADEFKAMSPADLKKALKGALSLRPDKLGKDSVKELYKNTYEFLNKLKDAADMGGKGGSDLGSRSRNAAKELETLYKLNNLYPHFELPIKLTDGEGQSNLYVYANKKNRQITADRTSALLHLNMPHLGQVDIHLELNGRNLGLRFYTEDEAHRALERDLSELTDKLKSMDYSVKTTFNPPEAEKADEAVLPVTSNKKSASDGEEKRYNFDIRA